MPTDELLIRFLAERDEACPICGYALRGLAEPKCPECGEPLSLGVRPESTRIGWWIAGLLGWALSAGFFVVLLVGMIVSRDAPVPSEWSLYLGAIVSTAGLSAWVILMRRLRRASHGVRVSTSLASIAIAAGLLVLFFVRAVA